MHTNELFTLISSKPEFKLYATNYRAIKFRHKRGTLTAESYEKIFNHFGYVKQPDIWEKIK